MNHQVATQVRQQKPNATPTVSGLYQRRCACGNHTMAGSECAECGKKKRIRLQTKLRVNEPGGIFEQEAAQVADQVLARSPFSVASGIAPGIQCYNGQANIDKETVPAPVDQALSSPGRQLESTLRQDMEPRFGHDFSRVRVHTDSNSAETAQELNALAFTVGQNIFFGAGEYRPQSRGGIRLLAHELAHTIQQQGDNRDFQQRSTGELAKGNDRLEHEAEYAAEEVTAGRFAHVNGTLFSSSLQMQGKDKEDQSPAPKIVPPVEPNRRQKKMIDEARRAAAIRTQIAMFKASGIEGESRLQEARSLARIKFDWANPNMEQISEVLSGMGSGLISVNIKVAGAGDPECGARAGYVRDHRAPIILCPGFFSDPGNSEGRIRTLIHEMAHVKGIGKSDAGEQYFPVFDCTSVGSFDSADSWANYVHCLSGEAPDKPEEIVVPTGGKSGR